MAHLLIVPVGLYIFLATVVLQRSPRGISNIALATYLFSSVVITYGYLVLATTADETGAKIVIGMVIIFSSWAYIAFLPLTIIALFFETWLQLHRRQIALMMGITVLIVDVVLVGMMLTTDTPLTHPVENGFRFPWVLHLISRSWWFSVLMVIASQSIVWAVTGIALHTRRLTLWGGAVPFVISSMISILIPVLSPLTGARWSMFISALSYGPPVLVLALLVIRSGRGNIPLHALIQSTLKNLNTGAIVIDSRRKVIWKNSQVDRWLNAPAQSGAVTPPHIFELLRTSPLRVLVQTMLKNHQTSGECTFKLHDEEYIVRIENQMLDHIRQLPHAHLLTFHDVTASRIRHDLNERRQELLALSAISADINASLEMEQVIARALNHIFNLTDVDHAVVYLLDDSGQLRRAGNIISDAVEEPYRAALEFLPLDGTSAGYAMKLRQTHIIPDATKDKEHGPRVLARKLQAGITVPLIARDRGIGVLQTGYLKPQNFDVIQIALLEGVGRQLAIAIDNARLHNDERQQRRVAEALREVANIFSNQKLNDALQAMLQQLARILTYDRATVLLQNTPGYLTVSAHSGLKNGAQDEHTSLIEIANFPYLQKLFNERAPLLIADTTADPQWIPGDHPYGSWIGVPLVTHEQILGVLSLSHEQPGQFTAADLQTASTFADQAVIAVENTYLFENEQRQNRALAALNSILAASNEALTEENLSAVLLDRVLDTLNLHGGMIHHWDRQTGDLMLIAASGVPDDIRQQLLRIPKDTTLPVIHLPPDNRVCATFSVPLLSHGTMIGLLSVCPGEGVSFTPDIRKILLNIGQQLGVVLDNAILFEDAVRRESLTTNLARLSLTITAQLERDTVLDLICHESLAVFDAQGAYIWLIENNQLVGRAAHGPGAQWFKGQVSSLDHAVQFPARAMVELRPSYVNRVTESAALSAEFLRHTHAQAVLAVPLLKANIPVGVLLLSNTEKPDAYAAWLTDQIALLGVQAALAIQNVTLFDEIRHRLDQLRLVNEVGRYATAILSLQNLIEGVARKLIDILEYDVIGLLQVDADHLSIHTVVTSQEPFSVEDTRQFHPILDAVGAKAVLQSEPVIENRSLSSTSAPGDLDYCLLAIPLIVADEVISVFVVIRQELNSITQDDLDVLETLAAQLAISVQNARLFETVRQQKVELEQRVLERTAEIRKQKERTEAILGSLADAVIVYDLAGQVVMTNPVARELFNEYDLDMDLGTRIGQLIAQTPELDSGATETVAFGKVALQAKATRLVEGNDVLGSVIVVRDISQLQELDRMKDRFVSNVSHELRTPLANLKLYLSLLRQGRPERRANYLDVMDREIERLARLITELLDLSRLESEERAERPRIRQPVDLEKLIKTVIQNNSAWAESERKELLHEELTPFLPWVQGDPDQLLRALTNLVSNAIHYSPEGSRIWVRSEVSLSEQRNPEWVIIEVNDSGIGIPDSELPVIFERFYRGSNVDPNIPGTGLGLAIVKEIMELHGGNIAAESQEGQGSTFRLKLPTMHTNST